MATIYHPNYDYKRSSVCPFVHISAAEVKKKTILFLTATVEIALCCCRIANLFPGPFVAQ